jgi:hypothetical protein
VTRADLRWRGGRGLIAFALCVCCVEGLLAGFSRSCMASFNLDMLLQFMEMMNVFLIAPMLSFGAGVPAFIVAASPKQVRAGSAVAIGCAAVVLVLILWEAHTFVGGLSRSIAQLALVIACGLLVGALTRRFVFVRRFWLLIGVGGSALIGVVTFALGHYSATYYTCWP